MIPLIDLGLIADLSIDMSGSGVGERRSRRSGGIFFRQTYLLCGVEERYLFEAIPSLTMINLAKHPLLLSPITTLLGLSVQKRDVEVRYFHDFAVNSMSQHQFHWALDFGINPNQNLTHLLSLCLFLRLFWLHHPGLYLSWTLIITFFWVRSFHFEDISADYLSRYF